MNYYNYFTEIEDAFVRRRGKHLFLSPLDWALMESWKQQQIPLHLVLRAIERAFDSFESRPRKRSVKSLFYCQEEVEAQFAEWLESQVGANATSPEGEERDESHFSRIAIQEHLRQRKEQLKQLVGAHQAKIEFAETVGRAMERIEEIEEDLARGSEVNSRRVEDSLTGIERMLNDALLSNFPSDAELVKVEVKGELKPYRAQIEKAVYQQTLDNLLLKRLRERFGVPRLSLFYL